MKNAAQNAQINIISKNALCQLIENDAQTAMKIASHEDMHVSNENNK